MPTYTYDPKRFDVVVGGHLVSGLDEGDAISIEPNADLYTDKIGNQGDVVRSRSADSTYTLTLRLLGGSPSNSALAALVAADRAGNAAFSVMIRNTLGREFVAAATAWVSKRPALAFGAEAGPKEWVIRLTDVEVYEGGVE